MSANNSTNSTEICGLFLSSFQYSSLPSINLIVLSIANIFFALAGIFLNSLVIYVFLNSAMLRDKVYYFLVVFLSGIDLAVAFVVHPLSVLYFVSEFTHTAVCSYELLYNSARHLLCSLSNYVLLAMSIERYLAVVHPFFYQRSVTRYRLGAFVGIIWLFISGQWLLSSLIKSTKRSIVIFQITFFFIVSLFIYTKIYIIARKKQTNNPRLPNSQQSQAQQKYRLKHMKLSSVYILVTLTFVFCYCPTLVAYGLEYLQLKHDSQSFASVVHFRIWARTFVTMNSTFNCLIFFWKNPVLRNESKKILKCLK